LKKAIPFWDDEKTRDMMGESIPSYFDNGDKIAEIQGCFIMAIEFSKRILQEIKHNLGNGEFFYKMIKQRLESAELILKTNKKNIPHGEYVTLEKMLEDQWKSYHTWKIVFQKLDSKKGEKND